MTRLLPSTRLLPFALLALVAVACAAPAATTGTGGSVVDAQSTINAAYATANAQATQMAESARGTAGAIEVAASHAQSTRDALAVVAAQATTAAQSTRDALAVRETEIALAFAVSRATDDARTASDVATSEAAVTATADAQRAANLEIAQRDTERQLAREGARYTVVTVLFAIGLVLMLLCVALIGMALVWRVYYTSRNPLISAPAGYRGPIMFQNPFSGITVLEQQTSLPVGEPRRALTAGAEAEDADYTEDTEVPPRRDLPLMIDSHVIAVGETTTGKSGVLRALIKQRPGDVYVVDPHYRPGSWPQNVREVVGVAGNYDSVEDLMRWLGAELQTRIERRAANDVDFSSVTVAMDEQPDLNKKVSTEALDYWKDLVRQGAKYRLYVLMGTQSMLVKEMGIEGESSVLRNFEYRILLGSFAIEKVPTLEPLGNRAAIVVQSRRSPVPVVIPYNPHEDPRSSQFRPRADLPPVNAATYRTPTVAQELFRARPVDTPRPAGEPMIVLPLPQQQPASSTDPRQIGMFTSRGWVEPSRVRRVLEASDRGLPHYRIEQHAFDGKDGGAFYYMTREVLEHFGLTPVQRVSTNSTD